MKRKQPMSGLDPHAELAEQPRKGKLLSAVSEEKPMGVTPELTL